MTCFRRELLVMTRECADQQVRDSDPRYRMMG